ncbi:phospholipase D-like domain-containing protein [Gorillibacterium timonense]|uniref:phospholipase D-like domain-containing protein n=1 Tax=Gorillibacterium timonense TaxID=1689269 RepID=UPI00071E3185|nr:phospholipase D-like domain-containing protein [Gorillibacterium timonense]
MTGALIILVILACILLQVLIVLLSDYRNPASCAAWILIQLPLPLIGLVLYRGFGRPSTRASENKRDAEPSLGVERNDNWQTEARPDRLETLLRKIPAYPLGGANDFQLFSQVKENFERILADMEQAQSSIELLLYIVRDDRTSAVFRDMLERKAREGVSVRLLLDGAGSHSLSKSYVNRLKQAGVEVAWHYPLAASFFKRKVNERNHRRLFLMDHRVAYVGGINLGDEYLGGNSRLGYWRDSTIRLAGTVAVPLTELFERDWIMAKRGMDRGTRRNLQPEEEKLDPTSETEISGDSTQGVESRCDSETGKTDKAGRIFLAADGPDHAGSEIYKLYFAALTGARRRIYVASPYFIPDEAISVALATAAASGVDVRILLPEVADHKITHYAGLTYAAEMAKQGVRFYLYRKGFFHGKALLVDDRIAAIGTFNLDYRSFFSSYELNIFLTGEQAVSRMEEQFQLDFQECRPFDLAQYTASSRNGRLVERVCRLLAPLL